METSETDPAAGNEAEKTVTFACPAELVTVESIPPVADGIHTVAVDTADIVVATSPEESLPSSKAVTAVDCDGMYGQFFSRQASQTEDTVTVFGDVFLPDGALEVPPTLVVAPDGGWGWVVVAVSFLCAAVVDGLGAVFGILLPHLVTYYDQSSSRTAFAGSLLAGGFQLFG